MTDLIKFICNVESIEDTRIRNYIDLAAKEPSPQVYKPRKGKVNGNYEKFA